MEINGEIVSENVRYADLGLSEPIMKALEKKGYEQATPVQGGAIPYFMEYKDVIAKAPTGTGKTFAFGIPMVEHIDPESSDVLALVLAPTRELAIQIRDELRDLCAFREGVRVVCLYGGQPIDKQITQLKNKPQIVVATPGRLMDHMKRRTVKLDSVQTVVLDEADRMLDMGFIRDVTRILDLMPQRRNLGLFSATISREVMDISWVYQRDPVEITVRADEQNKPDISQYRLDVDRNEKVDAMVRLMEIGGFDRVIAFCNTKNMTDRLSGLLRMRGVTCEAIHGDIQQRVREKTLQKFTASAAPAGPSATGWPTPWCPTSPRASAWTTFRRTPATRSRRWSSTTRASWSRLRPRDEAGEKKTPFCAELLFLFPDPGVHHLLCREHRVVRQQLFCDRRHRVGPLPGISLLGSAGGQLLLCGGQLSGLLTAWTVGAAGGVMAGAGRLPGPGVCPGHPLSA